MGWDRKGWGGVGWDGIKDSGSIEFYVIGLNVEYYENSTLQNTSNIEHR